MRSLNRGKALLGIILLSLRFFPVCTASELQSLTLDSPRLKVSDTLVSPSGHFQLGIFPFQQKYFLCIRYAPPMDSAVVWVANRDSPLTYEKSYLKLSDGNLQLFDQNGANPWSSNTANASVAKLLDTGNLVLEDSGRQIWNSFNSSITDTLLPAQYLNKTDGRQNTLTSWLTIDNPASGNYTFGWGTRANVSNVTNVSILQLACQTCQSTIPGGAYVPPPDVDYPHIISNVEHVYFHPTLGGLYFPSSRTDSSLPPASTAILSDFELPSSTTLKRLTLDTDGGLRIWQWTLDTSEKWTAVANWVVYERGTQCFAMGTCGPFGLCQMTPPDSLDRVQCTCPEGFEPIDKSDVSKGCNPKEPLTGKDLCSNSSLFDMKELDGVDMPWGGDYDNYTGAASANCKEECLKDCNCAGAVYSSNEQRCWKKKGTLYNLGYPTVALHGNDRVAYIKISKDQPKDPKKPIKLVVILGPVLGGVFGIGVGIFCVCRFGKALLQIFRGTGPNGHGIPPFSGPPHAPPQPLHAPPQPPQAPPQPQHAPPQPPQAPPQPQHAPPQPPQAPPQPQHAPPQPPQAPPQPPQAPPQPLQRDG